MLSVKKFLVLLVLLGLSPISAAYCADETIALDTSDKTLESGVTTTTASDSAKNIEKNAVRRKLESGLTLFSTDGIVFESGPIKSIKLGAGNENPVTMTQVSGKEFSGTATSNAIELYALTKFRNDKTSMMFMFNPLRNLADTQNGFTEKVSEISIIHKFTKNQSVIIGQAKRLPIGVEGSITPMAQDMVLRAQIARNFGNTRSLGVRNIGNYKYMDYDIGYYDSSRYMQDLFNGSELAGWVNFKPMAKLDPKKYGSMTVGAGYDVGKAAYSYNVVGTYLGYKYKKFATNFEYANANGYNGAVNSPNKAQGFYTTVMYDVTPKIQLAARYDYFDPNKNTSNNSIKECGVGATYFFSKKLKFLANYVRQIKDNGPDSNMFLFAARFTI